MTTTNAENKDMALWAIAKKRAGFRSHLITYVIINAFLWSIWYFSSDNKIPEDNYPWPIWTTLGWGIGLVFHFAGAYVFHNSNSVEREYQKLLKQNSK